MLNIIRLTTDTVRFPGLGIDGIEIDNVAFRIGSIVIYKYGVLIAFGMFLCVLLAILQAKKNKFSADLVIDVALAGFPAAIVGARLYYVFSEWSYYKGDIFHIINIRDGGLAVIGGVLAAIFAGYILAKVRKIPAHVIFDYCIVYVPLGQAIGRWGNFFNQEAFGTNTDLPWGMISGGVSSYLAYYCPDQDPGIPVHPTFLYESLATMAIFFALLLIRNKSKFAFTVTSGYLVFYGVIRFLIEGLRTDSLYIGDTGLRLSQVTSVMMVIVGIALVIISRKRGWKRCTVPVDELTSKAENCRKEGPEEEVRETNIAETAVAGGETSGTKKADVSGDGTVDAKETDKIEDEDFSDIGREGSIEDESKMDDDSGSVS
ncbi:MAG: prolipoprotein diacylglyceryl transferase [Clostridiales bacterium]|nr:prolipoprotein diacylglyceryl transferase [Clostridiales bacterium]